MACPIWGVFLFARDVVLFTHQSDNTRQQHPGDMPIVPSDSDGDQNRYVISAPILQQQVSTDAGSEGGQGGTKRLCSHQPCACWPPSPSHARQTSALILPSNLRSVLPASTG